MTPSGLDYHAVASLRRPSRPPPPWACLRTRRGRRVMALADGRRAECTARDQRIIQKSRARHSAERPSASDSFLPPSCEAQEGGRCRSEVFAERKPELRRMGVKQKSQR